MNNRTLNIIIIIVLTLILIVVPIIMKKVTWKKLLKELNDEEYDAFFSTLDSTVCKLSYSAFNREYMRLSAFIAQRNDDRIEQQLNMLKNMRISNKQKASVGARGFYYYLEKGKIKKAEGMLSYCKNLADERSYKDMEIQYSILLKKEAKYIDECKEKLAKMTGTDKFPKGTMQYLIGLQYSYKDDIENMMSIRKFKRYAI